MTETRLRDDIARLAASLYDRGLTYGSSGNISARLDDGWLLTPTGTSLGDVDPARLARACLSYTEALRRPLQPAG